MWRNLENQTIVLHIQHPIVQLTDSFKYVYTRMSAL